MPVETSTLPIPDDCPSALLYGGAFDPPHVAHLALPPFVRESIGCDKLLYLPAAAAPMKDGPAASADDRVAMLQLGLEGVPRVAIATLELDRPGPSYTVDTLREIADAKPATLLRFLIGADQARQFHKWREAGAILDLAQPAVMLRPPHESPDDLLREMSDHWPPERMQQWRDWLVSPPPIEASSTRVRELLEAGRSEGEIQALLLPEILGYIREKGLYAGGA